MMTKNKRGHNFLPWIVAAGLTAITVAGCAEGPLTASGGRTEGQNRTNRHEDY